MADTIAAVSTGGGITAIGVIRLSGDSAVAISDTVFHAFSGRRMADTPDRKLSYGEARDAGGGILDVCLCTVSRAPSSYTGEDTAEFHLHGSPAAQAGVLTALFRAGARQAERGEFTKRAFLNGKLDLTQAEAVIDLIEAETAEAASNAAGQLLGAVGEKAARVYNSLLDIIAHFCAVIDYPDEDIDDFALQSYLTVLQTAAAELRQLLGTFARGRILRDGVPAAIIGRPNAGKSSLLNALLGYERAIVTETPGTTRDTIEEKLLCGHTLLRLTDTAGIRDTNDSVERQGVARAKAAAERASLIIAVFDVSSELSEDDRAIAGIAENADKRIFLLNKADLKPYHSGTEYSAVLGEFQEISAKTGAGVEELISKIDALYPTGAGNTGAGEIITNARQADALTRACESIESAMGALGDGVPPDAVLTELEAALSAIGELTGKTVRDDVVARIFERFCVGK
jgi:tRNA modification GTPase